MNIDLDIKLFSSLGNDKRTKALDARTARTCGSPCRLTASGGSTVTASFSGNTGLTADVGGTGGNGGTGAAVSVTENGNISTGSSTTSGGTTTVTGNDSIGILAQSIGGGGGNGGFAGALQWGGAYSLGVTLGGKGGTGGNAADVNVAETGNITTLASNAASIVAQSVGGGGGNGGFSINATGGGSMTLNVA